MSEQIKCDVCGAPATIHLTQIINGKTKKINLCEKCAVNQKANKLPIVKFVEMISEKFLNGESPISLKKIPKNKTKENFSWKCPSCGLTELEFNKQKRLGCEKCISEIPNIDDLLYAMSHKQKYEGRGEKVDSKLVSDLEIFRDSLREALKNEDYEKAISIKERIQEFEQEFIKQINE